MGIPHSARLAIVERPVPGPAARAHGGFFRRTKTTSLAWGLPKMPCSRLRARNLGTENKAESVCVSFMASPGQMPPGVCLRSRTRFEVSPRCPNPRRAAELGRFTFAHLSIPICAEPDFCCKDPDLVALLELGLLTTPCHFLRLFDLLGRHV